MSKIILTAKDSNYRLSEVSHLLKPKAVSNQFLTIETDKTYQTILGFGGAFTESACYNLYRVSKEVREKALKLYFDPEEGIGYTLGRVSIHGCDFSLNSYTYIEEGDIDLKTFNISRDKIWVIPTIKDAERIAGQPIKLLGSPWTPPAFMKDNNSPIRGGHLLEEFADAWARYYVRFIEEYRKEGMTIWGVSVQNEPAAVQRWDSCIYSAIQERDFVKNHLGPILTNSSAKDVNILVWDHNRDVMVERVTPILSDPETAKYVWGTAFHWYVSEAFENVGKVHDLFPNKGLLFTEGCVEDFSTHKYKWESGERYARNMMGDLLNHCQGYIDWNLFLDNLGGPNHVNNVCDAPIILDIFPEKIIQETSYYYIGHISKFVKPGAVRLGLKNKTDNLLSVAFKNPNGEIALVVMNSKESAQDFTTILNQKSETYEIPARSIITLIF
jgi:glucosylceramidase